jgi:peptidyl-tRNA hydrolase, PTH1 family
VSTPGNSAPLDLIVGIGNPGNDYAETRHNVGVWFVDALASWHGASFKTEKKFQGRVATIVLADREVRLLVPDTYMNHSGRSVGALVNFYKIPVDALMIAHDEIDFPVGKVRFKQGGGLAGHNGLRDISSSLGGNKDFNRLRIGVGHPGHQDGVTGHVLGKVSKHDRSTINACIDEALRAMPLAVGGDWQGAMQQLHNAPQPFQAKDGE